MPKTLAQMMTKFKPEEQGEIQAEADELIAQEMTLQDLRKAYQLTQVEMCKQLGVEADTLSNLEQRTDLLLSILTTYIHALGGNLNLVAEFPQRKTLIISRLADLSSPDNIPITYNNHENNK